MTPKEAIDTLTNLAANRIAFNGENDPTAAFMLGVIRAIEDLSANADAQRDRARLDHVLTMVRMSRADVDFDMGARK